LEERFGTNLVGGKRRQELDIRLADEETRRLL
jgi:hypothetical protein